MPCTPHAKRTLRALIDFQWSTYKALGVSPPPTAPMLLLGICVGDGATVSELADTFRVDIKTASRILKAVRAKGWAVVETDPKDERRRRVRCTREGERVADLVYRGVVKLARDIAGPSSQL